MTMSSGNFVAYYRVSTERQGRSGLGLEAQREAVTSYLNGGNWRLVGQAVEVESAKNNTRPELEKALRLCRLHGATLIIAKLDRLSRDAHFLLGLQKELAEQGLRFVAADMPEANELTIGIMAVVAQAERKMISARTKAALKAAKTRGVRLGGHRGYTPSEAERAAGRAAQADRAQRQAELIAPVLRELEAAGVTSLAAIADALNARGIPTSRGGERGWTPMQVSRLRKRLVGSSEGTTADVHRR